MKKIAIAIGLTAAGLTALPAVADMLPGRSFIGIGWGESSANYHASGRAHAMMPQANFDRVIDDTDTWSLRAGQELDYGRVYLGYSYARDSYHGIRLRQQALSVSYDHYLPLTSETRLFGGVTAGATYLSQISTGYTGDRDWGVHAGIQAGLLQDIGDQAQLELGYRYTRHSHNDVDFKDNVSGMRTGSARLKSTDHVYLGLNYRF